MVMWDGWARSGIVVLGLALLSGGCSVEAPSREHEAGDEVGDDAGEGSAREAEWIEELLEADRAFARRTSQEGVEGWVATFADDGKLFRNPGGIVEGHEAIRRAMAALDEPDFSLTWEPVKAEVSSTGDLGYTHGTFRSEIVGEDGRTTVGTGRYVTIWRRAERGEWKVALDIGNPDSPAPPPPVSP